MTKQEIKNILAEGWEARRLKIKKRREANNIKAKEWRANPYPGRAQKKLFERTTRLEKLPLKTSNLLTAPKPLPGDPAGK